MNKTCILNLSNPTSLGLESDRYLDLRKRSDVFQDGKFVNHCRSWHSWAYALETEFFVYGFPGWPGVYQYESVIVLVNRDLTAAGEVISKLKSAGKKVAISFHEGIQDLLKRSLQEIYQLKLLVDMADCYINIFGQYQDMFVGLLGRDKTKFANHTAPFEYKPVLTKPWKERTGDILVSTRTFSQHLSRNTICTLSALSGWLRGRPDRSVDFICEDQGDIRALLDGLGLENIGLHKGPLEFNDWLEFLSNYKWAVSHDLSMNLGQVSLDCALLDVIPIGGTTWFNIEMGSSDRGDLRSIINILEWDDKGFHLDKLEYLRDKLNSDIIAQDLRKIFDE